MLAFCQLVGLTAGDARRSMLHSGVIMILDTNDVNERLQSPRNLINQLAVRQPQSRGLDLFTGPRSDELIPDVVDRIKESAVKTAALDVLHDSLINLKMRVSEIDRAKDLSVVALNMKRILTDDDSKSKSGPQQIIVYKPIMNEITHYETITVSDEQ